MDELAKRFADLAQQYGPDVVKAALAAVQTEVYSDMVGSFLWLAFAVAFIVGARWSWPKEPADSFDLPWGKIGGVIGMALGVLCLASFVWTWADPWTWTALNHPELYIAKKAMHI